MVKKTPPDFVPLLRRMWLIRAFEEKASALYAERQIVGLLHLGIGQEAVAVGACSLLRADDFVYGGHRSHGHAIAKGADISRLLAEIAGRATGYCGGKGGSMHIVAKETGFITATGVASSRPTSEASDCARRLDGDLWPLIVSVIDSGASLTRNPGGAWALLWLVANTAIGSTAVTARAQRNLRADIVGPPVRQKITVRDVAYVPSTPSARAVRNISTVAAEGQGILCAAKQPRPWG